MTTEQYEKASAINDEIRSLYLVLQTLEVIKSDICTSSDGFLEISSYQKNVISKRLTVRKRDEIDRIHTSIVASIESRISKLKWDFEKL